MSRISSLATEYRYLPLTVKPVDGAYPVLDQSAVQWRITGPGHDGTLHPVDALVPGEQGEWFAGVLIGPGALELAKGAYLVGARISDTPEQVEPRPQHLRVV